MNKNSLIEEELKNKINELILEELTVNDEVLKNSKMVEEYIMAARKCKSDFLVNKTHTWCEGINYKTLYKIW